MEQVLTAVESIPPGRACAYSDLAELVGRGGPRQVGQVMARYGDAVPWWRVVRADGRPARGLEDEALARLRAEGTPIRGDRVDLGRARFLFQSKDIRGDSPWSVPRPEFTSSSDM